jgi:hypothetical protein
MIMETRPYTFTPAYPTPQHERSAQAIVEYFSRRPGVSAVLLTCSCARGKASPDSCLDIDVLAPHLAQEARTALEQEWEGFQARNTVFQDLKSVGAFSQVDLNFHDGQLDPARSQHGWTSGADEFELEVGNLLAYSVPLWEGDSAYHDLKAAWLPYYGEELRRQRLEMALRFCRNNLAHIPLYVGRGLYFQAFKRLYNAFGEFLQALFIARRTYPIAYDKWVREQVVEILGLDELYPRLVHLLEVCQLESDELVQKADELEGLISTHIHFATR